MLITKINVDVTKLECKLQSVYTEQRLNIIPLIAWRGVIDVSLDLALCVFCGDVWAGVTGTCKKSFCLRVLVVTGGELHNVVLQFSGNLRTGVACDKPSDMTVMTLVANFRGERRIEIGLLSPEDLRNSISVC